LAIDEELGVGVGHVGIQLKKQAFKVGEKRMGETNELIVA
jgi:hypothetical protein